MTAPTTDRTTAPTRPVRGRGPALRNGLIGLALGGTLLGALPGTGIAVTPAPTVALPPAVEDLQPYVGQEGCDPVAKPGVLAFQQLLMNTYRDTGSSGIVRDCGVGGQSEHKEGRAFDWTVSASNPAQVAEVKALTDWLTAYGPDFASNARRFGIMYMIWNRQIWRAYQPERGWQPYSGASPHTDHVHFSFGWAGARKATSWWTGRVAPIDYGPYTSSRPRPPTPPAPRATAVLSAIDARYAELGGPTGILGAPNGPEEAVQGGVYRQFVNGAIYWSAATGAHEVFGEVRRRYQALGASRSVLGLPTSGEYPTPGGTAANFQYGMVLFSPGTGAHALYGAIYGTYLATRGPAARPVLGLPTTEEHTVNGGQAVEFQLGRIYWSVETGAHEVHGALVEKYVALGAENAFLRLPTTDEVPSGPGRGNGFQVGALFWSAATGAHEVHGAVLERWAALGGPGSVLGLPTTDEVDEPGGRSSGFVGGHVYWSPALGAQAAFGAIDARYRADGGAARYGLPVAEEYGAGAGSTQEFERAYLDFNRSTGAVDVRLK